MIIVGLTGSIATGKSTIAKRFHKLGALIIEADSIGHDMIKRPEVREQLVELFGDEILDEGGEIDRNLLADEIFISKRRIDKLNKITHPLIIENIKAQIEHLKATGFPGVVVIEAALLPKWDLIKDIDFLIIVKAPEWRRKKRLIEEEFYTKEDAERRIRATKIDIDKISPYVDFIVENIGTLDELRPKIVKVWMELQRELDYRKGL